MKILVFLSFILAVPLALGLGGSTPLARDQASAEELSLLNRLTELNRLRDKVAGNWTLALKYGINAPDLLDNPDEAVKIKKTEEELAALVSLFASDLPEDRAKAEQMIQSVRGIGPAERKYADSLNLLRNDAANILLSCMATMHLRAEIANEADAVVLGVKPLEPLKSQSISKLQGQGRNPEVLDTPEIDLLPAPAEARPPSSDPEMLRLAYEALQACRELSYQVDNTVSGLQLALYDENQTAFYLYKPNPESAERALTTMSRLPGLTDAQRNHFQKQSQIFQQTAKLITVYEGHLQERKQAKDDLESLVESALSQIDELRDDCLSRLLGRRQ
jgi:hypothetical protein